VPLIGPWSSGPALYAADRARACCLRQAQARAQVSSATGLLADGQERSSTSLVQTLTAGNPPGMRQTPGEDTDFQSPAIGLAAGSPSGGAHDDKSAPTLSMLPGLCTRMGLHNA